MEEEEHRGSGKYFKNLPYPVVLFRLYFQEENVTLRKIIHNLKSLN